MRILMFIVLTSLVLIAGCGQKGPLFLPQDEPITGKPPAEQPRDVDESRLSSEQSESS